MSASWHCRRHRWQPPNVARNKCKSIHQTGPNELETLKGVRASIFVNVRLCFHTNNVIPYKIEDDGKFYKSNLGRVRRIRNGYQTNGHAEAPLATYEKITEPR